MRTFLFLSVFIFALLMACSQPAEPEATDPPATEQTEAPQAESGEPLAATEAAPVIISGQRVYCGYHIVRGGGAIQHTGGIFIVTKAWQTPPAGQQYDPTIYIRDLVSALEREQLLAGVDLTKTKSNWVEITSFGASPRADFVSDTRDLPQPPKKE